MNESAKSGGKPLPSPWTGAPWSSDSRPYWLEDRRAYRQALQERGRWWYQHCWPYSKQRVRAGDWTVEEQLAYLVVTRCRLSLRVPDVILIECGRVGWDAVNSRIIALTEKEIYDLEAGGLIEKGNP